MPVFLECQESRTIIGRARKPRADTIFYIWCGREALNQPVGVRTITNDLHACGVWLSKRWRHIYRCYYTRHQKSTTAYVVHTRKALWYGYTWYLLYCNIAVLATEKSPSPQRSVTPIDSLSQTPLCTEPNPQLLCVAVAPTSPFPGALSLFVCMHALWMEHPPSSPGRWPSRLTRSLVPNSRIVA